MEVVACRISRRARRRVVGATRIGFERTIDEMRCDEEAEEDRFERRSDRLRVCSGEIVVEDVSGGGVEGVKLRKGT